MHLHFRKFVALIGTAAVFLLCVLYYSEHIGGWQNFSFGWFILLRVLIATAVIGSVFALKKKFGVTRENPRGVARKP